MRIGEVAARAGVPVRRIRFYEDEGLIEPPDRTDSGYRDFDEEAVRRLVFIGRARRAGLTLDEIKGILTVRKSGEAPCSHARQILSGRMDELEERIASLTALRTEVAALIERSATMGAAECDPDEVCSIFPG